MLKNGRKVFQSLKFFSTAGREILMKPKEPSFLVAPNGNVIPYPVGIERPIRFPVILVGEDSLKSFLPEDEPGGALINKAKEIYLNKYRSQLMAWCRGNWMACSSDGDLFVTRTQQEASDLAHKYFQPADRSIECYVGCVGSEFSVGICMDNFSVKKTQEGSTGAKD